MRIPSSLRSKYLKDAIHNGLKLLTYDIETSHMLVRTFYIGQNVNIHHHQIKEPSKVISIQYKWAHEKKAKYLLWDKVKDGIGDTSVFDDSSMIEEFITNILSQADIVLTQNGDKFDFVTLNERAKALKLSLMDQKPSMDILKLSRKSFRSPSHKLDYRSQQQGFGGKIKMCDEDWIDIEEKGIAPEKKMVPYGLKDVEDTEKVMWNELGYYKDLPVPVEKVILACLDGENKKKKEMQKLIKPYCRLCALQRQSRFDLTEDYKDGIKIYQCNRCGGCFDDPNIKKEEKK